MKHDPILLYIKCCKVITSCRTLEQLETAKRYTALAIYGVQKNIKYSYTESKSDVFDCYMYLLNRHVTEQQCLLSCNTAIYVGRD